MMHLEVGGRRVPVAAGEMVIGSDFGATLSLVGEGVAPQHAVVQGWTDGSAAVRALGSAEVLVNGVRLGGDPTPLLHGDKIQVGGHEILAVDVARVGSTQLMGAVTAPEGGGSLSSRPPAAAGPMSDGRVVCLTDGREYQVGAGPLVFGREAGSDVVVTGTDVSRRHAEIRRTADGGYVIADLSANGTSVNGARIDGERALARADVIRIGTDEFRFYASATADAGAVAAGQPADEEPAADAARAGRQPWEAPDPPAPALGAAQRLSDTMNGIPATPTSVPAMPARVPPPIASILVRSGPQKGERLTVRTPVANIGRADYNDLVVPDASVSTMHAKLVRREGLWMIADLGSTNGSWVDEERVEDELPLSPGATIRLGEVTMMFEPLDVAEPAVDPAGARATDRFERPAPEAIADAPPPARRAVANGTSRRQTSPPPGTNRLPVLLLALLIVIALGLVFFVMN